MHQFWATCSNICMIEYFYDYSSSTQYHSAMCHASLLLSVLCITKHSAEWLGQRPGLPTLTAGFLEFTSLGEHRVSNENRFYKYSRPNAEEVGGGGGELQPLTLLVPLHPSLPWALAAYIMFWHSKTFATSWSLLRLNASMAWSLIIRSSPMHHIILQHTSANHNVPNIISNINLFVSKI